MSERGDEEKLLEMVGELDAHAAEALRLEILRLARRCGLEPGEVRVEIDEAPPSA